MLILLFAAGCSFGQRALSKGRRPLCSYYPSAPRVYQPAALPGTSQATANDGIDAIPYAEFRRRGLLRHIAIEEKILLPAAQRTRGGDPLPVAARPRLDHAAIAALLVPTPTRVVATLRDILGTHNWSRGARRFVCNVRRLLASDADAIVRGMASYPDVRVSPHNDGPGVLPSLQRALERTGTSVAWRQRPRISGS